MTNPTPPSVATPADRERIEKAASDWIAGDEANEHRHTHGYLPARAAFLAGAAHSAAYWEERVKGLVEALEHITDPEAIDRRKCCKSAWLKEGGLENHDVDIANEALAAFRAGKKETGNE